jgi:hypothetical protein
MAITIYNHHYQHPHFSGTCHISGLKSVGIPIVGGNPKDMLSLGGK